MIAAKPKRRLYLCRHDDNAKSKADGAHYWDVETGRTVPPPTRPTFTPERMCPVHEREQR
jgi:hypothetical protein